MQFGIRFPLAKKVTRPSLPETPRLAVIVLGELYVAILAPIDSVIEEAELVGPPISLAFR
jgi:hypothetical protein